MPKRETTRDAGLVIKACVGHALAVGLCILSVLFGLGSMQATAQGKPRAVVQASTSIVMLSDLHFDPFHDPDKIAALAKAPISEWSSILAMPDSAAQEARFASMQKTCKAKDGTDAPYTLLRSSLEAAKVQSPSAGFVTVSGDLLVHDLDCRYRAAMHAAASPADDQSLSAAFAEKTTAFVIQQVQGAFPRIPVYVALGNNDSRCNHNRLDLHDEYLKASGSAIVAGLRGSSVAERMLAKSTYESAGYYALTMPAPMVDTRLVVLNDIYMMPAFANCEAAEDHKGEQEQLAWLRKELDAAQAKHQHVWVLGHLSPAVNPDASLSGPGSFCSGNRVVRFQDTEELTNLLTGHADAVTLGIFGHTHMDEFHVLAGRHGAVPIKVVASVSPVDGNLPSFTVGTVDPASATLTDYSVYEASNRTGVETRWVKEYDFDSTYHEPSFTPVSLSDLISRLRADKEGVGTESREYKRHFLKGSNGKKLSSSWPGYVCSLDHATAAGFKTCVCSNP